MYQRTAVLAICIGLSAVSVSAQLVVTQKPAADLAQTITGRGVTLSNVTLQGNAAQGGSFSGGVSAGIGIESGIILSTGDIATALGPNASGSTSTDWLGAGDTDLNAVVAPNVTYDAAVLQFDFVPQATFFTVRYVFASEEYLEFVGSEFNDVFAFYLNGTNIARIPGGQAVTVNTVNNATNSAYYRDNGNAGYNIEFDGFTTVLTATAKVTPGQQYHFKFAIADTSDGIYDAAVFIEAGSFEALQDVKYDFNGDRMSDIFWRNSGTGSNSMWLVNGPAILASATLPRVADTNFKVAGIGDFQGDNKADLVWRNSVTGANVQWLMSGATIALSTLLPGVADVNWTIVGVGDVQGDGKADIIWRNVVTGENAVWVMDGPTVAIAASLPMLADTTWTIVAVGDFQGDGKDDILWRNTSTGANVVWLMNGAAVAVSAVLPTVGDPNWKIVGAGDLQGDGKADVIWRNSATGDNAVWFMNGTTLAVTASLPSVPDTNWKIVRLADFQGDGKSDILWRHSTTGSNAQWLMNGPAIAVSSTFPPVPDATWEVAGRP